MTESSFIWLVLNAGLLLCPFPERYSGLLVASLSRFFISLSPFISFSFPLLSLSLFYVFAFAGVVNLAYPFPIPLCPSLHRAYLAYTTLLYLTIDSTLVLEYSTLPWQMRGGDGVGAPNPVHCTPFFLLTLSPSLSLFLSRPLLLH